MNSPQSFSHPDHQPSDLSAAQSVENPKSTLYRSLLDGVGAGLSFLCLLHCLALPILMVFFASEVLAALADEKVHLGLLLVLLPLSMTAFAAGFKYHGQWRVPLIAFAGGLCLILAVVAHSFLGEIGEKAVTLIGSVLLITGHWMNRRFPQCEESPA